jgi:hypothetical protein
MLLIVNIASGFVLHRLAGHVDEIHHVSWSPNISHAFHEANISDNTEIGEPSGII